MCFTTATPLHIFFQHEDYGSGSGTVKPVTMATADQSGNPKCYITGWGYTTRKYCFSVEKNPQYSDLMNVGPIYIHQTCRPNFRYSLLSCTCAAGSGTPTTIQEAKIQVYSNADCNKTWGGRINNGHVCVGDPGERKGFL